MYERQISGGSVNVFLHMSKDSNYQVVPSVDSGTLPYSTCSFNMEQPSSIDLNQIPLTVTSDFFTADSNEGTDDDAVQCSVDYKSNINNSYSVNNAPSVNNGYNEIVQHCQEFSNSNTQRWPHASNLDTGPTEDYVFNAGNNKELQAATDEALQSGQITPLVKEELKSSIQIKRLKEGKDELRVSFEAPVPDILTPEEEVRVELRRTQNRDAARRFRDKQKRKTDHLQKQCHRLEADNSTLRSEMAKLRREKDELATKFQNHLALCPLNGAQHPGFYTKHS